MQTTTDLMPHQAAAVEKLLPIKIGALFMEMGTGKSRTAIELVRRRRGRIGRVVWFCPVSLKETTRGEILKHTDAGPGDVHLFDHRTRPGNLPDPDPFWHVVGIESMSASNRIILAANRLVDNHAFVIVDESQYIKGHRSARTCWITDIAARARYRLILTGTPMSQGVVDLFAQFRFLAPQILGYASFYGFALNHLEYHPDYPDMIVRSHNTDVIAAKIKPYVYQVTKDECLDLPDKLYERRWFHMTGEQRTLYDQIKEDFLLSVDPEDFSSIAIFKLFSALQQVACGFYSNDRGTVWLDCDRMATLLRVVTEIPAGEKIIVWAKYVRDIEAIAAALEGEYGADSTALFYGKLSEAARNRQVERFRAAARFFVATPSCGGHGLTLNEAAHVVYYSCGFKYAERLQAEDRCHRIGQGRPVTYIDIICADSIDERIQRSLALKGDAVADFRREVKKINGQGHGMALRKLVEAL